MKKKPQTGVIVNTRPSDEPKQDETESSDLEQAAEDFMKAINTNNKKAAAEALRAAFEICDASPHVEGEHLNESED